MESFFFSFWWLLFPLAFFIFGAWDRWLSYQRSKDRLDLLRTYTAQGKDPPPELLRALRDEEEDDEDGAAGAPRFDPYDKVSRRMARRYYRYRWRASPHWAWRSAIVTAAVAAGFWFAAEYAGIPGIDWPFRLVAIIMACVAAGNLVAAIFATTFRDR